MNMSEYKIKYRAFAGHIHDFSDPVGDEDDEGIARRLRADLPAKQRIAMLEKLVPETQRMLDNLDNEWEVFSDAVNHLFTGAGDARTWLSNIRKAWIEELARLKNS